MKVISHIEKFGLYITGFVLHNPYKTLLLCLLVVAAAIPGLPQNSMSTDHRSFFGPTNPQLMALDNVEDTYNKLDNVVFVIKTEGKSALDQDTYPIIQYVTERAWQLPAASRVDSLSNYQHTSVDQDDLVVEDLLDEMYDYSPEQLKEKADIVLSEPLLVGNLISKDLTTTAVNVVALLDEATENNLPNLVAASRELVAEVEEKFPGTRVALTGAAMISMSFTEAGTADSTTLIPGMYLMLFVALLFVYRSLTSVIATFIIVSTSTIVPLGLMGYSGIQLTSLSIIAPIIIMTLAVADCVHILVTMLNLMRGGMSKVDAMRESLRINFLAVAVTSITTIIGFLCLNFSDTPPYHHLGNMSSVGIFMAWMFSVTLLPALIMILPLKVKVSEKANSDRSKAYMRSLAIFTTTNYKVILVSSTILFAGLISQLPKLELNDSFVKFFDTRVPFRVDTDYTQEHLGGIMYIHYDIQSGEPQGINNANYLKKLDDFSVWLRAHPHVTSVYSYSDIAKRLNKNMNGDGEEFYTVPDQQELAAQYLLVYEMSLPYGLDMTDRINLDKSATRLSLALDNPTAREVREFSVDSAQWLKDYTPEPMWAEPTGAGLLFSYISGRNIDSMIFGNIIAVIAIAIVLVLALEHLGLGILSLLPNVLPVVLALSLWSVFVGVAGMATTIVAASSLGIVVDNTTHFLSKYLRARREQGKNKKEAISYSFETVGIALIANAVVLISGFAILAYSTFLPNFHMGALTAITIAIALIVDLICLPALLMIGGNKELR